MVESVSSQSTQEPEHDSKILFSKIFSQDAVLNYGHRLQKGHLWQPHSKGAVLTTQSHRQERVVGQCRNRYTMSLRFAIQSNFCVTSED